MDSRKLSYDDSKLQVIVNARFSCQFDLNGMCAAHGTHIQDHDAITTYEEMTIEEAKRRYPKTDPKVWEDLMLRQQNTNETDQR